jgi:hypothetical protein
MVFNSGGESPVISKSSESKNWEANGYDNLMLN